MNASKNGSSLDSYFSSLAPLSTSRSTILHYHCYAGHKNKIKAVLSCLKSTVLHGTALLWRGTTNVDMFAELQSYS